MAAKMSCAFDSLVASLIDGERERALAQVGELIAQGRQPLEIVTNGIETAMAALDRKCTAEQFNLLEIMLAGRAVVAVIHQLFPSDVSLPDPRASVVTAVLEGDIHDIGKSILKVLLAGARYRAVDCGKDVSVAAVVRAVAESGAVAVCISGLISSILPQVRMVRPALAAAGLGHVKVLAGGAALKQCDAATLEVDFVGQTAFDAVHFIDALVDPAHAAA
jgi:5-methyltetrahydrofolate--homocysteine methyltransferase